MNFRITIHLYHSENSFFSSLFNKQHDCFYFENSQWSNYSNANITFAKLNSSRIVSQWEAGSAFGSDQSLVGLFLSLAELIHLVSSESVHNFLQFCAIYRFGLVSQWLRINLKIYWIRIFTKIESVHPYRTSNLSNKFCPSLSTTLWDILLTNKQTDRHTQKTDRYTDRNSGEHITSVHFCWQRQLRLMLLVHDLIM